MKKILAIVCVAAAALVALPREAPAAPSGLNNIPTADTAPHLALVIQEYSTFGSHRKPDHIAGFKFGIDPWSEAEWRHRFEWGVDGRLGSGDMGPAFFSRQIRNTTEARTACAGNRCCEPGHVQ